MDTGVDGSQRVMGRAKEQIFYFLGGLNTGVIKDCALQGGSNLLGLRTKLYKF